MKTEPNMWIITIFSVIFVMYVSAQFIFFIERILRNIAFSSKSQKPSHVRVRKMYWPHVKRHIRIYVLDHCRYIPYLGDTVGAITMYELDREVFYNEYITGGVDKLKVKVLTKTEEITKFVIDWRAQYQYATTEEILSLYLIENKNQ